MCSILAHALQMHLICNWIRHRGIFVTWLLYPFGGEGQSWPSICKNPTCFVFSLVCFVPNTVENGAAGTFIYFLCYLPSGKNEFNPLVQLMDTIRFGWNLPSCLGDGCLFFVLRGEGGLFFASAWIKSISFQPSLETGLENSPKSRNNLVLERVCLQSKSINIYWCLIVYSI